MKKRYGFKLWFCVFLLMGLEEEAFGAVIQFPDEELPSEYVFPVFKKKRVVLNRNVSLDKRLEISLSTGFRADEPVYHFLSFAGTASFYWSEFGGLSLTGMYFWPGLSRNGQTLRDKGAPFPSETEMCMDSVQKETESSLQRKTQLELDCDQAAIDARTRIDDTRANPEKYPDFRKYTKVDVNMAPRPAFAAFLSYRFSPFYGKISLTKRTILNLAIYGFLGGGIVGFELNNQLKFYGGSNLGIGQRFYLGSHFSIDMGIDFLIYYGPGAVSKEVSWVEFERGEDDKEDQIAKWTQAKPARTTWDQFKKELIYRLLARVGISIIF